MTSGGASGVATTGSSGGSTDGGAEVVLDNMTSPGSVTGGSWYTYSDRTVPNSEPPIVTAGAAGTVVPKEGDGFYATPATTDGPMVGSQAQLYRDCQGGGETVWGAGFGMDITSAVPDGGAVVFNSCDAGMIFDTSGTKANVGIPQKFDAVALGYTGFSFWGRAVGSTAVAVAIQMDDDTTSPWAGKCAACQSGGKCSGVGAAMVCPCSDSFATTVNFPAGTWTKFTVKWTDIKLARQNWSGQGKAAGMFNAHSMYNIHFQLTKVGTSPLPAFDVQVAYLTWTTN